VGDVCCGFGEVVGVDGLWFWGLVGVAMVVVLGKCAGLVEDNAASLNI
jgi:hypothetical protein